MQNHSCKQASEARNILKEATMYFASESKKDALFITSRLGRHGAVTLCKVLGVSTPS